MPEERKEGKDHDVEIAAVEETLDEIISPQGDEPTLGGTREFEGERVAFHKGVTNCQSHQAGMVDALVNAFAAEKAKEMGREPIWKGHRGGSATVTSGKEPWPSNKRWCRITVRLNCVAIFAVP